MSQFDQDCITYTQEGRLLQLEYAVKAVESAEYTTLNPGPLSQSSARTESFLALRNKCYLNCSLITLTAASITSIELQAQSLQVKFRTDAILQYTPDLRPTNSSKISASPSQDALWLTASRCTSTPTPSTTPSDPSVPPKSWQPTPPTRATVCTWSSHPEPTTATPAALRARAVKLPRLSLRRPISAS